MRLDHRAIGPCHRGLSWVIQVVKDREAVHIAVQQVTCFAVADDLLAIGAIASADLAIQRRLARRQRLLTLHRRNRKR